MVNKLELTQKEKEYCNYIDEHVSNVKTSFLLYGKKLCELLNISYYKLSASVFAHDKSKYNGLEFEGYRQWFYPCDNEEKNKKLFDEAWKHHYENNEHHPEYWVKDGVPTGMSKYAIAEMLLDWSAMGMKFGNSAYEYYQKERDKKPFSENDKFIIDNIIYIFK